MDRLCGVNLGRLPLVPDAETRSISAENPTGEKGGGARAAVPGREGHPASRPGRGRKVSPCIELPAGGSIPPAGVEGAGVIQHVWIRVSGEAYRGRVLRFYWDGEETPSAEGPPGDCFCSGHGLRASAGSLPVAVNPVGGFHCCWPMPFRRRARIPIENRRTAPVPGFFYQMTYALTGVPPGAAMFYAQWRRPTTAREHAEQAVLDGVRGQGQTAGSYLAWTQLANGWWGEGEIGRDLRVTIEALGRWPDGTFGPLADDIAPVAYWYQAEPHARLAALRPLAERWPR